MGRAQTTKPARKPAGKRRRLLLRLLVLLVIIALGAYWLLLPGLVHRTILHKLSAAGVTEAAFDLRHVSWRRVLAANVQLGLPSWLRVGTIDAEYGLGGIAWGDPDTVQITGGQWTVRVRDGAIDLGPAGIEPSGGIGRVDLPFARLEIRSSALLIDGPTRTLSLPVEGSVVRRDGGQWQADLRIGGPASPVDLRAVVNGSVDLGPAMELSGRVALAIAGCEIDARGALLTLQTGAGDASSRLSFTARLGVETLEVGDERIRDVKAFAQRDRDGLVYRGSAQGGRWRLSVLDGRLPSAPAPADGERVSTARWEVTGQLPAVAVRQLSDRGVDVQDVGRLTITGRTSVHVPTSGDVGAAAKGWRVELPDVHARLEPGDLSLRGPGVAVRGLSGDLNLAAAIDPTGLVLDLRPESSIEAAGIEGPGFRSGAVHAVPAPKGDQPLVHAGWDEQGPAADIAFEMSTAGAVSLEAGGADATIGGLALDGRVQVDRTGLVPDLQVALTDAGVRHRQWNLEADGISGTLRFKGLAPMSTPGQHVLVEHARFGRLDLTDGQVIFTVEQPDSVLVERAEWQVAGGTRMRTIAFRFDPGAPVISTELYAEDMALSRWLPLLTGDRATGEGMVYGRLAVTVRPRSPSALLTLGEGFLYAAPGRGWIKVRDAEKLETWLDESDVAAEPGAYQERLKQRLVETLQDFEYWELRIDLIDQDEGLLGRIATAGRGRRGEDPQEIGQLVIRIHDLNGVLNDLLSLKSAVDRAADRRQQPPGAPAPEGAEP